MLVQAEPRFKLNKYPHIKLDDREGNDITIGNIQSNYHHKSLGYLQSANNPSDYQKLKLTNRYNQMTNMDFKEVQTYYHTMHSPKIQYITQMFSIPINVTKDITRQGTTTALRSMGCSSKTPHGITYGHTNFEGLEMIDVHMLQGAQNLINFTQSVSSGRATHCAMKTAYLWWHFTAGRQQCPLQQY
jgi:hypothetical protein